MGDTQKPFVSGIGFKRFVDDIKRGRHRYRQFVGIMFLALLTIVGAPIPALYWPGVLLTVPGIVVRLWASGHVKKNKQLAVTGPYAFVRHPLYVGNHLIMFGFCAASGLWWSFVAAIALSLFFYPQTIREEDSKLARLFPDEWPAWASQTRALIPRLTPYRSDTTAEWSFSQSRRQNGEPIIALVLLLCLYVLYGRLA